MNGTSYDLRFGRSSHNLTVLVLGTTHELTEKKVKQDQVQYNCTTGVILRWWWLWHLGGRTNRSYCCAAHYGAALVFELFLQTVVRLFGSIQFQLLSDCWEVRALLLGRTVAPVARREALHQPVSFIHTIRVLCNSC